MTSLEQIRKILKHKKSRFSDAGIVEVGIFGSYVRGEQEPTSDIDILIDISRPAKLDLLDLIDLEQELSDELGVNVDLVLKSTLKPSLSRSILSEVIYL